MFQPINNLTIANVSNDRNVIALILENLQLFRTQKICVMPEFRRGKVCYIAYIEVAEWFDREAAYNLIQNIKNPLKEARIVYSDDNWCAAEKTVAQDLQYTQDKAFKKWTTEFFEKSEFKEPKEKKQVTFKKNYLEQAVSIEDLDIQMACRMPGFDFIRFCEGFAKDYGFNFEEEYAIWEKDQNLQDEIAKEMEELNKETELKATIAVNEF